MSAPARQVRARQASKPRARTSPSLRVVPTPKRKKSPVLFYVLAGIILGGMVLGIAVTHVLLAQGAFRVDLLSQEQAELRQRNGELLRDYLEMSTSDRIAAGGRRLGLVFPATVEIVRPASGDPWPPRVPVGPG